MASWPGDAPSSPLGLGDGYPVYNVSWEDAQAFVTALNARIVATGQGPLTVRLPSESEWEYACRAGSQTRFHFGDSLSVDDACEDDGVRSRYMWYCGNANGSSQPVGTKLPNAFGLYDTSGNVWEWCEDWWHGDYTGAPTDGSAWILNPDEPFRILRGGSWDHYAQYCRSALRDGVSPSMRDADVGFRIAGDR